MTSIDYVSLSQRLLYAVRTGGTDDMLTKLLKVADRTILKKELTNDELKKTFWLNIYNAFVQILLTENPKNYKNRNAFFSFRQINITGRQLSLDDIEHGILRRSKIKWSLGYLNKFFLPSFEKEFRVAKLDNRIHFALNCGAKSCPPIAYYSPEKIETQLELATQTYLQSEAEYEKTSGKVLLPKMMEWFRGDFGGKTGIIKLLKKYNIIDDNKNVKIEFKPYDWRLFLKNYQQEVT